MAMKRLSQPATDSDRVLGSLGARIVIVEYGDYDCPHTRRAQASLKQLMAEAGGELALVFRVFPLRHIHENAEALARIMWAVPKERFWEAHDALMALRRMSVPIAAETLTRSGFDAAERERLDEGAASDVQREVERGQADGVHSTPSFFFNGAP
jgi:protein-disulfide isomerase